MAGNVSILVCLCISFAVRGSAHAILMRSTPSAKQVVAGPDIAVTLTFNSRIDAKRSRLTLVSTDGSESLIPIRAQPSTEMVTGDAKSLKRGSYVLRWQVLANDGHITRGEIPFTVQ